LLVCLLLLLLLLLGMELLLLLGMELLLLLRVELLLLLGVKQLLLAELVQEVLMLDLLQGDELAVWEGVTGLVLETQKRMVAMHLEHAVLLLEC